MRENISGVIPQQESKKDVQKYPEKEEVMREALACLSKFHHMAGTEVHMGELEDCVAVYMHDYATPGYYMENITAETMANAAVGAYLDGYFGTAGFTKEYDKNWRGEEE